MSPNLYLIKFDEIHRVFAVWGSCNSMYDINRATKSRQTNFKGILRIPIRAY
jgi:hypothetical protein